MAANRQINYIKPSEPSFLTKFKKDVGYKEGPTVDTKARKPVARSELVPYEFSRDQEGELVEWYRSNAELYDKNHQHYRSKERKNSLLKNKAKEYPECTYAQLRLWFKSQRTRYGKLSQIGRKCNGRKFTPREQWIIDKWGFIKSHIVRVTQVETRECTKKFNNKKPLSSLPSGEQCDSPVGTCGSTLTPSHSQQHSKRRRTTAGSSAPTPAGPTATGSTLAAPEGEDGEASHQELIKLLIQHLVGRERRPAVTCSPHERAVDAFLGFLKTELLKIPEEVWFNYTIDAMRLAQSYTHQQQQLMVESPASQTPSPELSSSAGGVDCH